MTADRADNKEQRAEGKEQKAEGKEQRAEGKEQRAEGKEQKAEGKEQRAEGKEQKAEGKEQRAEGKEQRAEGKEQRAEGKEQKAESKEPKAESKDQSPDFGANGGIQPGRYYGHGLPYVAIDHYPGKIIAIEGTDGVGRSTQIALLREWLEVQGYGVVETGWTRSALMQPTIELAKSSNTLNKLTFVLLYATDFADRLEKEIIPALKAGFVVLSDRYIFSALARAGVRGVDRAWLRSLYGFAIAPHLVFYLKIDVDTLIRRVLSARGMDFWESGMDLKGGDDIYDSFRSYQNKLLREYGSMADEFGFRVLDARRPIGVLQEDLRRQVQAFLSNSDITTDNLPAQPPIQPI